MWTRRNVCKHGITSVLLGALVLMTPLAALAAPTRTAGPVEQALQAALHGPEKKKLKIFGHHFNVKKVERFRQGSQTLIYGQLSHHLRWRPDDQLYYRIVKEKGRIVSIEHKISRGGWASLVTQFGPTLGALLMQPIQSDQIATVSRRLETIIDGRWETAALFLIGQIALYTDGGERLAAGPAALPVAH